MRHKILIILLIPCFAGWAQQWDGESVTMPQLTGSTYQISTGAELAWVAQQSATQSFEGYTFIMNNDIDLGESHNWTPIGGNGIDFQGTFDGGCHTIKQVNILYSLRTADIGFFGAIGTKGTVKNLAIESGKVFISDINNVGSIAGRNDGTISHCFAMLPIVANASNNTGGIAGLNNGTITYCYQAGYISDAGDNAGGLIGQNTGKVSNSYCIGYTISNGANCGSVVGLNKGTFENTFFDQQMCLQKASTKDETGITAISETRYMSNIFAYDHEWFSSEHWYPQLACFTATSPDASLVSVLPVWLPTEEAPIQRAETVSKNFTVCTDSNAVWISPDKNVIEIKYGTATVSRQCSKRTIVLTVNIGDSKRGILLQIVGFNTFDPGIIGGYARACHGDAIKFSDKNKGGEIREPIGGRDDDKKAYPYYFIIEQYELIDNNGDNIFEDTVLFNTFHLDSESYKSFLCDTEHDGHWLYRRYVHDSQCQLDYLQSAGEFQLNVFGYFDSGELSTKPDTIYGDYPKYIHTVSTQDATGGEGPYSYEWYYTHLQIDYVKGDTVVLTDSVKLKNAPETAEIDTIVDQTGEYLFFRAARDLYCNRKDYVPSREAYHVVVFDSLRAGAITDQTISICANEQLPNINQTGKPTGGNGIYSYRWLMNNEVINSADSSALVPDLFNIPVTAGSTYVFQRQVKDNTGLMDWTTSEGTYSVHIYSAFDAGEIFTEDYTMCLDSIGIITIPLHSTTLKPASGDGEINYQWYIHDGGYTTTLYNNQSELKDTLTLDITKFKLPTHLCIHRQVQNPICGDDWLESTGYMYINIDTIKHANEDIILCREDMPYTGQYLFSGGETKPYQFSSDGQVVTLSGGRQSGCDEVVTLTCHVTDVPDAEITPIGIICQTDTQIHINYHVVNGNPNHYLITYNSAAYEAGFVDIYGELTDLGRISIPVGAVPLGDYIMYLTFIEQGQAIGGCKSRTHTLGFSVNLGGFVHQKWNDVLYIDNNDKNGFPDAENDLQFIGYQWYKDGELIEGATSQVYNEQGGLNGTYYAILTGKNGAIYKTCPTEVRPTGLTETDNRFDIYPNIVTKGEEINLHIPENSFVQLFSTTGQLISSSNNKLTAPMIDGIYIVRLTTADNKTYYNHIVVK